MMLRTDLLRKQQNNKYDICGKCRQEAYQPLRCRDCLREAEIERMEKRRQRVFRKRIKTFEKDFYRDVISTHQFFFSQAHVTILEFVFRSKGVDPYVLDDQDWINQRMRTERWNPQAELGNFVVEETTTTAPEEEVTDSHDDAIEEEPIGEAAACRAPEIGRTLAFVLPQNSIEVARENLGYHLTTARATRGRKDRGRRLTGAARRAKRNRIANEESQKLLEDMDASLRIETAPVIYDEVEEDIEDDANVTGEGDCWKQLFWLEDAGFSGNRVTAFEIAECTNDAELGPQYKRNMRVRWCRQEDQDYHIIDVARWVEGRMPVWHQDEEGWTTLQEFIDELEENNLKTVKRKILGDILNTRRQEVLVGTGVNEVMNAGKVIYGPEVLKGEINKELLQEISAAPRTEYYLSLAERASVKRYIGTDVASASRKPHNSDHYQLLVARDLARRQLLHLIHPGEGCLSTVCMGATFEDYKLFKSHSSFSYYLHLSEAKDDVRVFPPMAAWIANEIASRKLPGTRSVRGESTKILQATPDKLIEMANDLILHRPAFTKQRVKASQLLYMDSLYSVTAERLALDFEETGAQVAYATMLIPSSFYERDDFHSSELYTLTEDYDWPDVTSIIDAIWPDIVLAFAALDAVPSSFLGEFENTRTAMDVIIKYMHGYVKAWITAAFGHFCDWIRGAIESPYPYESAFGLGASLLKYDIIIRKWLDRLRTWFRDKFMCLTLTWKNGYSNGYRHNAKEWRKWAVQRVFRHRDIQIVSEVISRWGEMCIMKFWRSDRQDVIVHQPSPPEHLRTMRIWDWNKTLNNSPFKETGVFDPIYTHCRVSDFYEVYSWAIAEPSESLDFSVVATACNRTRRGLDLISNVSHHGLTVRDEEMANFALNVYLTVVRDHKDIAWIESMKSLITSGESTLEMIFKKIVKSAVILATGGLAIPIVAFAGWLFSVTDRCDFVEHRPEPTVRKEHTSKIERSDQAKNEKPIIMAIPAIRQNPATSCMVCGLLRDGDVTGQTFAVDKCTHEAEDVEMGLSPGEAASARNFIEQTIDAHRPFVSGTSLNGARAFESFVSTVLTTGTNFSTIFHYVLGGPGTGKSYIARALMYKLEKAGYNCMMYLPLAALKADYDKATINGEQHKFTAETWFMSARHTSIDVLFVDEFTLVDSIHFKAYINYTRPKWVFLIGDEKQQHKSPDISVNPGLAEGPDWPKILAACSIHELQRNFRFTGPGAANRVKWLNHVYGYRMYSHEPQDNVFPVALDLDAYRALTPKPTENFVFAHQTAQVAFGVNSAPGPGMENHSVYSSQGRTCDTSAIAVFDADQASFNRHGSIIVAMTRSRQTPIIVVHDLLSATYRQFRDAARIFEDYAQDPWPDVKVRTEPLVNVDPANRRLNEMIEAQKLIPVDPVEPEKPEMRQRIVFETTEAQVAAMDLNVLEWALPFFETCTYDALPMQLRRQYLKDVMWPILEASSRTKRAVDGAWEWNGKSRKKFRVDKDVFVNWLKQRVSFTVRYQSTGTNCTKCASWADVCWEKHNPATRFEIWNSVGSPKDLIVNIDDEHVERLPIEALPSMLVMSTRGDVRTVKFFDESPTGLPYGSYWAPGQTRFRDPGLGARPTSIKRVENPEMPKWVQSYANCPKSQWISNHPEVNKFFERPPASRGKLRLGKDNYRFAHLIDGSEALRYRTGLQHPSVVGAIGKPKMDFKPGFNLNFANTFFPRTKSGKITRKEKAETRALVAGAGNLFVGSTNETLRALQRVCGRRPTKGLSKEGYEFFEKHMTEAHRAHHKAVVTDVLDVDRVVHNFWKDARTRNYLARAEAEKQKFSNVLLKRVTNKVQYKPHKDGRVDNFKTGQTITTTSPYWNLVHGAAMRVVNLLFKQSLQDDVFFDSHEPVDTFRVRMAKAIEALPVGVQFGIVDGEEFDAGQTHGTLVAEMIHRKLSGISQRYINGYYRIREPGRFVYSGTCGGRTDYEKGSGFSDTLIGNTTLEQMIGHHSIVGKGPRVVGLKGDDYFKAQFDLKQNFEFTKTMERYTNLKLKVDISLEGGEFTGCTVGREGMYISIPRVALKAVATRFRNYKHFAEYQKSLREKILQIKQQGFQQTIEANAAAMGISVATVESCVAIIDSVSHMSEKQFEEKFRSRKSHAPPLPRADGRVDMLTFNSF